VGEAHPTFGRLLNYLGMLHLDTGDLERAEHFLSQSLEVNRQALGERHPFFASCQVNAALLHAAGGRLAEALRLLNEAADLEGFLLSQAFMSGSEARRLECLRRSRATTGTLLSLALDPGGAPAGAVASACRLVLRRKGLAAGAEEARRDAVLGGRYPELLPYFQRLTALRRQFARKALARLGPHRAEPPGVLLEDDEADELHALDRELSLRVPEMDLRVRLWQVDQEDVAAALPQGSALVEYVRFPVHDFHAVAARGQSPWKQARYAAFVLPEGAPHAVALIDLGGADAIDRLVAGFRSGITREAEARQRPGDELPEVVLGSGPLEGERLRQAVLDPLRAALGGRTQLILAPDGDLNRLPFEALPDSDGRHLLDRYRISYVATGRDVLRFGMEPHGRASFPVVVADPDFDLGADPARATGRDPGRQPYQPLPATRVEGEHVAGLLGDGLWTELPPWLGGEALEGRLKGVRSPWVLHLATHGFFLPDPPAAVPQDPAGDDPVIVVDPLQAQPLLRSGVALAGANGNAAGFTPPEEAEDGLLTAADVTGMDLLDTELVVLSACETALGPVEIGEGVFGLRRAFLLAGARALVMSLWKVPDLATAVLMERLYYNLLARGMDRAEALREAQASTRDATIRELRAAWLTPERIERLAAGSERRRRFLERLAERPDDYRPFSHPRSWGAFICQGDPGPLNRNVAPPNAVAGPGTAVVVRLGLAQVE
jgi:CHAT domain-containing protein